MKSLRIAVVGSLGRMGKEIIDLAAGYQPTLGFQVIAVDIGQKRQRSLAEVSASQVDVVIDFSLPDATEGVAKWCSAERRPLVSGVTGLSASQQASLREAAANTAVFHSPNMSLGVAVVGRMLANLASLDDFDFQIEELHHRDKKDQPSGTALRLQEKLAEATGKPLPEPISMRAGGAIGVHRVLAFGEDETIILEHQALNRRVFARGALRAARWLSSQPPGMYGMDDLLRPLHL